LIFGIDYTKSNLYTVWKVNKFYFLGWTNV
jgi:hypothetical protein